jgi:hypothetical protein
LEGFAGLANVGDGLGVVLVGAVGEVHAGNVHADVWRGKVTILHFIKMKVYIFTESCMPRGKTFLGINIIEIIVNVTNVIYHNTICSGR